MSARVTTALLLVLSCGAAHAQSEPNAAQARTALERAAGYFRDHLSVAGTYVWKYSLDGKKRVGEGGAVPASLGWVQPPGTPAVGAAFLRIFEVTADRQWLDAAHAVASALVRTQLESGGWFYAIETDPAKAANWCYRENVSQRPACHEIKGNHDRNETVLDDDNTQSALTFLMWFDKASGGSDAKVREAIDFGLHRLMKVQYRIGAFPVFFSGKAPGFKVEAASKASLPASWSHTWQKPDAPPYFIVNDNLPRDMGRLFLNAYRAYGDGAYLQSAVAIGNFLLAAQLPSPQQGWAQAYDRSLTPVWGRKFEPPAVASRETAGSIEYLIELHHETGDARYLNAATSAAEWLKAARLPDGAWARYYELGTNRPLYVDSKNAVTFEDKDLLQHYGLKTGPEIEPVLRRLALVAADQPISYPGLWISVADDLDPASLKSEAGRLIDSQDAQGRWTRGKFVDGKDFVDGIFTLARLLSGSAKENR